MTQFTVCTAYATCGLLYLVYEMCSVYLIFLCLMGQDNRVGIETNCGLESGD